LDLTVDSKASRGEKVNPDLVGRDEQKQIDALTAWLQKVQRPGSRFARKRLDNFAGQQHAGLMARASDNSPAAA
jgi:hypothetical protein